MSEASGSVSTCDIAVVGAGIVGCSIAHHLAERGLTDVCVIERQDAPRGVSTARATGGIRAQFTTEINVRMSLLSMEILSRIDPPPCEAWLYWPAGYLFLTSDPDKLEAMREAVEFQRSLGCDVKSLSAGEASALAAWAECSDVIGGTLGRRDGFIKPVQIAKRFFELACDRGVYSLFDTEVTAIERLASGDFKLATTSGEIHAGAVVNAAGPLAPELALMLGLELPIVPVRRQILLSNPCPEPPRFVPMTIDADHGILIRRDGKRMLIAWADPEEQPGFNEEFDRCILDKLEEPLRRRFPVISRAGIDCARSWAGLYAVTPDHHAILGEAPGLDGFYLANGFSGHGGMHSAAVGFCIAELIATGRCETIDIAPLSPERFERDELIEEKMVL